MLGPDPEQIIPDPRKRSGPIQILNLHLPVLGLDCCYFKAILFNVRILYRKWIKLVQFIFKKIKFGSESASTLKLRFGVVLDPPHCLWAVGHGFFLTSRKFVTSSCWYSFCCIRWKMLQCISQPGVLPVSSSLRLLPLYILALLKSSAFTPRYRYSGIFYIAYKLLVICW